MISDELERVVKAFGHEVKQFSITMPDKVHGVYFIVWHCNVFYVGRSTDIKARVTHHRLRPAHDSIFYVELPPGKIYATERKYIRHLAPTFNKRYQRKRPKYHIIRPGSVAAARAIV